MTGTFVIMCRPTWRLLSNVAISRARCPAVIFANPRLLEISCSTIAQMELVNGLCWARRFAVAQTAGAEDPTA
jgi:hypothetical protein